jgi:type IV pilus assembly protein PilP
MKRLLLPALLLALAACDDKPKPPPPVSRAPAAAAAAPSSSAPTVVRAAEYSENDFVESERNRDPFRTYVAAIAPDRPRANVNQREVLLTEYAIDELRLVAIVLGGDQPRAMFIDPTGRGHVIYRGKFLCKPEIVRIGGANGPEYQLNWRVDRIRDGDVVLIREDPAQPSIPPATRVIQLHPQDDKGGTGRRG